MSAGFQVLYRCIPAALITACIFTSPLHAQQDGLVRQARTDIAALGKHWDGDVARASSAAYAALHARIDTTGIRQESDIAYGDHPQQKIDLFVPEQGFREPGPVLVYFHGGGLNRGDKGTSGANVARYMARMGGIGINANYRLVPDARFPDGAVDVRLILEWIGGHVAEYGGDPGNVLLMGNSAGATVIAGYLYYEAEQLPGGPGVAGAVLASGAFRADDDPVRTAYFGADPALRASRDPLGLVDTYQGKQVPVFLFSAEYDVPSIETSVAQMYAKLCAKYQDCPMFTQFQGHNHVSPALSIDTADDEVAWSLVHFYHSLIDKR